MTPAQVETALRRDSGAPGPAPTAEVKKEEAKEAGKKRTRQKLGAWIAG